MKNIFLVLIALCTGLFSGDLSASETADRLFETANAQYSKGNYAEAVESYQNIIQQGFESAELYYNLGNVYFQQRNYPQAILNYERALLLNPVDEDVQHNLDKARIYVVDKIDVIPEFVLRTAYSTMLSIFSSNSWAIISMLCFVITVILFLIYFMSGNINYRRMAFVGALVLVLLSAFCFVFSRSAKEIQQNSGAAIVMSATVTVKSSPNMASTDLFIIHEGTKVYTLELLDNWYEIKLSDGKQGWMPASDLEKI